MTKTEFTDKVRQGVIGLGKTGTTTFTVEALRGTMVTPDYIPVADEVEVALTPMSESGVLERAGTDGEGRVLWRLADNWDDPELQHKAYKTLWGPEKK